MADTVILRGFTATEPQLRTLPTGVPVVNFRLASTPRWFDTASNSWREGHTSWYTVRAYRKLAQNIAASVSVGSPVLLTGRLRTEHWQRDNGTQGTSVEVDASSLGLDLTFGTSTFARTVERRESSAVQAPAAEQAEANISVNSMNRDATAEAEENPSFSHQNTHEFAGSAPGNFSELRDSEYEDSTLNMPAEAPF